MPNEKALQMITYPQHGQMVMVDVEGLYAMCRNDRLHQSVGFIFQHFAIGACGKSCLGCTACISSFVRHNLSSCVVRVAQVVVFEFVRVWYMSVPLCLCFTFEAMSNHGVSGETVLATQPFSKTVA